MNRTPTTARIARVAVALVAAAVFATLLTGCGDPVPNVKGLSRTEAQGQIVVNGYSIGPVEYDPHATSRAGIVIHQSPAAGVLAKKGMPISITISGNPPVIMPNLHGVDSPTAGKIITSRGLAVGRAAYGFDSDVPSGGIMFQTPGPGEEVAAGSTVNFVLSRGPAPPPVPSLVGLNLVKAKDALRKAGLHGVVKFVDDAAPHDTVIWQDPTAGADSNKEKLVTIKVSTGAAPVMVPRVTGLTSSQAIAELRRVGLKPAGIKSGQPATPSTRVGEVYAQEPSFGTVVMKGTKVVFYWYSPNPKEQHPESYWAPKPKPAPDGSATP